MTPRARGWALLALLGYSVVMIALTMLKAFFVIGMLWRPEVQRGRSVELVPFAQFRAAQSWFGPLFDALGNLAFFVPLGVLLYIVLEGRSRPALVVVAAGAMASASVEVLQYVCALGHSDVTDVLFNTTGALLGALVARLGGRRLYPVWIGLALALSVVFAVLTILGPRLGDPGKVVELGAGAVVRATSTPTPG